MMLPVECCNCQRKLHRAQDVELVKLTEAELKQLPEGTPLEFHYCKPCWRTLTDPTTGPQFGRGYFLLEARRRGVRNAEQWADHYFGIVSKHANKPSS